MSDDTVNRLQRLSDLHRSGELSDEEFAAAKREVLADPGSPAPTVSAPVEWRRPEETWSPSPGAAEFGSAGSSRSPSRAAGVWRRPWLVLAAVFCGFMFASAFTAVAPSSALWTGRILCDSPKHMEHQSADTSYGTTGQSTISFFCVSDTGPDTEANSLAIFGLQLVLGTVVAYVALVLGALGFGLLTRRT